MRFTRSLAVVIVTFWAIACAASQTSAPALPETLKAHLKGDEFQVITSMRGLPLGVRDEMGEMIKGQYTDFAEPGTPFRTTDVVMDPNLPVRRLVTAACATDHHCIVYYERGGIAHTHHVAVFQWTPDATKLEFGGTAPGGLQTIDAVRSAILSGAIKAAANSW